MAARRVQARATMPMEVSTTAPARVTAAMAAAVRATPLAASATDHTRSRQISAAAAGQVMPATAATAAGRLKSSPAGKYLLMASFPRMARTRQTLARAADRAAAFGLTGNTNVFAGAGSITANGGAGE